MRPTASRLALLIIVLAVPLVLGQYLYTNGLATEAVKFLGVVFIVGGIAMFLLRGVVPARRMIFPTLADVFGGLAILGLIPVSPSTGILAMSLVNIAFLVNERRYRPKGLQTGTA